MQHCHRSPADRGPALTAHAVLERPSAPRRGPWPHRHKTRHDAPVSARTHPAPGASRAGRAAAERTSAHGASQECTTLGLVDLPHARRPTARARGTEPRAVGMRARCESVKARLLWRRDLVLVHVLHELEGEREQRRAHARRKRLGHNG